MNVTSSGSRSRGVATVIIGVVAGFLVIAVALAAISIFRQTAAVDGHASLAGGLGAGGTNAAGVIPVPTVSAAQRAALPVATTETTVAGAPVDREAASGGAVIRVSRETIGFGAPGSVPVTRIPATQIGAATWLPVIGKAPGWVRVRLPSRPNGATAWIPQSGFTQARTQWSVQISLTTGEMTIAKAGATVGTWPIGQGRPATPTPVGATFLLAGFVDPQQSFSPVIYALGAHSDTLDTFGGGPGTVAVHGWPTLAGRTGQVSHGCVRVPAPALTIFGELPAGTPITIT